MTDAPIVFQFAGLPGGDAYCLTTLQRFAQDIANALSGFVPGTFSFFNYGNTEPDPDSRNRPWIRLNVDGSYDKTYVYFGGAWTSPNTVGASSLSRIWWTGTEAQAWSYDGGDGNNPSTTAPTYSTGAMWERDADYDARFALENGTLPSGTVLNPGDTGGEEKHTITQAELPTHFHYIAKDVYEAGVPFSSPTNANYVARQWTAPSSVNTDYSMFGQASAADVGKTSDVGTGTAMNVLGRYRVGMWLKRTARVAYTP